MRNVYELSNRVDPIYTDLCISSFMEESRIEPLGKFTGTVLILDLNSS